MRCILKGDPMSNIFINPFVKNRDEYSRNINVLNQYVHDCANFLHISTGKPISECRSFVTNSMKPNGTFPVKDPAVECLVRKDNGDRERTNTTLSTYISDAVKDKELIAPTLTTYVHPSKQMSLLATYIDGNVKARSVAKKAMFAAEAAGDNILASIKKIEQTNKKLANNSISGAHVSPSNPLYNPTAHSTLTSNCRSTSGYGNANNEKLLSGNRHYWSYDITLNNIVSIITHTDYAKLNEVVSKYNLHLPSVKETMECITYSTKLYWWDVSFTKRLEDFVPKLTPVQRAAFVYTGDLYHLKKHNNELIRTFIGKLSSKILSTINDPAIIIKYADEAHLNLAHQICAKETMGIGKKYTDIMNTPAFTTLAATVENIERVITEYSDLIKVFFVTNNVPASMGYFPESIRRCALTGDTDSTIFTVQDWVTWYCGKITFDDTGMSVAATMIFLASATISHILAIMSANFGVVKERIHQIEMKNEYKFDVFVPTQLGKHYFATIGCQEGNVFAKRKMEIKGVYLKSSNAPKVINEKAVEMMKGIMDTVMAGNKISAVKYLKYVADIERSIMDSIRRGEFTYLRTGTIKDVSSYVGDETNSPYQNHLFWQSVFAPIYGYMDNPPYDTMKVSVVTDSSVKLRKWIATIPDREFADRLSTYMANNNKTSMTTLNIPAQILTSVGMPKEVVDIIDYRKIIMDITKIFYILLETIGIYMSDDKLKRMASDYY